MSVTNEEENQPEELVTRVQGILYAKDLPPLWPSRYATKYDNKLLADRVSSHDSGNRAVKYKRQQANLTGLGTKTFESAVTNVESINMHFEEFFPPKKLQGWTAEIHIQKKSISASSRYFTERKLAQNTTELDFFPLVDQNGELSKLRTPAFFHGVDNRVEYYEKRNTGTDNKARYSCYQLRKGKHIDPRFHHLDSSRLILKTLGSEI